MKITLSVSVLITIDDVNINRNHKINQHTKVCWLFRNICITSRYKSRGYIFQLQGEPNNKTVMSILDIQPFFLAKKMILNNMSVIDFNALCTFLLFFSQKIKTTEISLEASDVTLRHHTWRTINMKPPDSTIK